MAYNCHGLPTDCAKVALDEGEETGDTDVFSVAVFPNYSTVK